MTDDDAKRLRALATSDNPGALIRGVTRGQVLALLDERDALRRERDEYKARAESVDFWRDLHEDGWTAQRVADELHDYRMLLTFVPKVYDHVTGGRISKPNTLPELVCSVADDALHDSVTASVEQALKDERVKETRRERDAAMALLLVAREWAPTRGHSFDDPRMGGVDISVCKLCGGVDDQHQPDCDVARIDALLDGGEAGR